MILVVGPTGQLGTFLRYKAALPAVLSGECHHWLASSGVGPVHS